MNSRIIRKVLLCAFLLLVILAGIHVWVDAAEETHPAEKLVRRVTPQFAGRVHFRIQGSDSGTQAPTIQADGKGGILICAENVREGIRAYGYYLRNIAHVHLSWNGDQTSTAQFIIPQRPIAVPPTLPFNFAFNYCTLSYTSAHWSRERWLQEIDRLALNGFHYVLITPGLEKVWQGFLADLGYPEKSSSFIANPCYSAWWHMGNLEGMGGPVSQELIDSEAELGRAVVQRATELGLEPVLQGYVGFIPHDLPLKQNLVVHQGKWVANYTRPALLRADQASFPPAAKLWYKRLEEVYGYRAHAFAGDLFHEGGNTKGLPLKQIAAGVQQAMQEASPGALWFLQAWAANPRPEILAGLSKEHTIILALQKNLSPKAQITRNYGGMRYVWCELANFGGKQGLYGGFDVLEKMSGDASGASGFGLLSEGLETNPIYYELFYERINNREIIARQAFLKGYIRNRYGKTDKKLLNAFNLLIASVYTPNAEREGGLENIMCARPGLNVNKVSTWSNPTPYYAPQQVLQAGRLMLQAAKKDPSLLKQSTFRYDLADVCRQVLADRARAALPRCRAAWASGNREDFKRESEGFCKLIAQTAELLATHEGFLLGAYLKGAEERGGSRHEEITRNLRRLITMWSKRPSSLNDYAHRQFSEIFSSYYLPRWQAFFDSLLTGESEGTTREEVNTNNGEKVTYRAQENKRVDAIEQAFPTADIPLLTEPHGDLQKLAEQILR